MPSLCDYDDNSVAERRQVLALDASPRWMVRKIKVAERRQDRFFE